MAPKTRTATAIRFSPETHERLRIAAEERDLSINFLVNRAVEDYLERLLPPDEMRLTRAS
jgi:predicted transcriptional regulator